MRVQLSSGAEDESEDGMNYDKALYHFLPNPIQSAIAVNKARQIIVNTFSQLADTMARQTERFIQWEIKHGYYDTKSDILVQYPEHHFEIANGHTCTFKTIRIRDEQQAIYPEDDSNGVLLMGRVFAIQDVASTKTVIRALKGPDDICIGDWLVWEPKNPMARELIKVTRIMSRKDWDPFVYTESLLGNEVYNDMSRILECCCKIEFQPRRWWEFKPKARTE